MAKEFPGIVEDVIPGTELQLGPYMFTVPPLLLIDLKRVIKEGLVDKMAGAENLQTSESSDAFEDGLDAILKVTLLSLRRNYPKIQCEELEAILDVGNVQSVVGEVLKLNNLAVRPTTAAPTPAAEASSRT